MRLHKGKETVLIIPDVQIPFHHKDTFAFLEAIADIYEPTKVVCIGDSLDSNSLSRYHKDPEGYSAIDEYKKARKPMQELYSLFPETVEVASNHNARLVKKANEAGIPSVYLRELGEVMGAPATWKFVDKTEIDGVIYEHGDNFGGMYAARNAALTNMESTVIGHHHSYSGVHYIANQEKMIFGMNVGCLIDMDTYAFRYAKKYRFKPTLSAGIVDRGVPVVVPMLINSRGRWIKEIV